IVPEYEVFDLGQLATLARLLDRHGPPHGGHVHVDLVMGVPGGMPGTAQALTACLPFLPEGATFAATGIGRTSLPVMLAAVAAGGQPPLPSCRPFLPERAPFAATGIGRTSRPVMLAALSAGGHLRVGMEDTLTYAPGEPLRRNTQLVARAV